MGFAIAMSPCMGCGELFSYNPMKVPSIVVDGIREPICEACVIKANPFRIANGLDPIVPLDGAYEPCDEGELA